MLLRLQPPLSVIQTAAAVRTTVRVVNTVRRLAQGISMYGRSRQRAARQPQGQGDYEVSRVKYVGSGREEQAWE